MALYLRKKLDNKAEIAVWHGTETEEELIDTIVDSFNSGFQMDALYAKRVDNTFLYRDSNNCKRVLTEVLKLSTRT